jgi:hypothetical protein
MQSQETLVALGGALRALGDGRVGGYLVPFTTAEDRDLYGTFFTARTYYGKRSGDGLDVLMHHGLPIRADVNGETIEFLDFAKRPFKNPMRTTVDERGIFAEVLLDMADDYERMIYDLVSRGVLKWSSGALAHTLDIDPDTGEVRTWMIGEGSLTPSPGTPFNRTLITPLRALLAEAPNADTPADQAIQGSDDAGISSAAADQDAGESAEDGASAIRATLLGDYLGPRLTMDALNTIHAALFWRVESIMYTEGITADEAVAAAAPYFGEYQSLALFTIGAILRGTAGQTTNQAVESIRAMYPRGDIDSFLRASQVLSGKNLGLLKEARDRIDQVIAAQEQGARTTAIEAPSNDESAIVDEAGAEPRPVRISNDFLHWLITGSPSTPDSPSR